MCVCVCVCGSGCVYIHVPVKKYPVHIRCAAIVGTDIREFQNETQLLREWASFVQELDPDIITGYNIINLDLPYLLNRAKTLKASTL